MKCSTSPAAIVHMVRGGMAKDISDYINELEAKVASLTKAGDWQPIETAPRGGAEFLAFDGCSMHVARMLFDEKMPHSYFVERDIEHEANYWNSRCFAGSFQFKATHWMPLPDEPCTNKGDQP